MNRQRSRLFLGRFRRSADVAHKQTVLPDGRGILRYPGMRSAGLPGRILQGVELHRLDRAKDPAVRWSGDRFAPVSIVRFRRVTRTVVEKTPFDFAFKRRV